MTVLRVILEDFRNILNGFSTLYATRVFTDILSYQEIRYLQFCIKFG